MSLLLVFFCFAGILAIDLPGLIRNRQWRDLFVYACVFLPVFVLAVLVALDVGVPSPIKAAQVFYRDILHLSFKPP